MAQSDEEYSDLKIFWHNEKLEALRKGIVTAPIYVRVKPTNACNHSCFDCVYGSDFSGIHESMNRKSEIPREKMLEILSDIKDMGVKAVTYSGGGEPLIYPHITEIMQRTQDYSIDLSIITNGQELAGEKAELLTRAEWVRVSSNSCAPEVFHETRRRPAEWFNNLAANIREFAKAKMPCCILGINFVVNEKNNHQVYESAEFYRDLGVNNIKFTPAWGPNFQECHAPFKDSVIEQIARARQDFASGSFKINDTYEKDFASTGLIQRNYNHCFYMQITPAIGADQIVYFCHNKAYDTTGTLGSIKDRSFKDLWFSEEARKIFMEFNPREGCRHQCTNDNKNKLIHRAIASHGRHVNFV